MKYFLTLFLFIPGTALFAQTTVENFRLTNVVDEATVSLEDCQACAGTAIVLFSNSCPYDQYYLGRIISLAGAYQGRIQFLLINSYLEPEESVANMKLAQSQWNLSIPYLADKDQVVMNALGARRSPEVFLLKTTGLKHTVIYHGALDDNPQVASAVTQPYLKTAMDQLLGGKQIDLPLSRVVGCSIRKK